MDAESRREARCFLEGVWGARPAGMPMGGEAYELRIVGVRVRVSSHTGIRGLVEEAATAGDGDNVYYGVCPRRFGEQGGKAAVGYATTAWSDVDKDCTAEEVRTMAAGYGLPPSCVVRSGHGYHLYWFLKEGLDIKGGGLERIESLNRAISRAVGGDKYSCDVSRLLRLPGSVNWKKADAPVGCRMHGAGTGQYRRYTMEELEGAVERSAPPELMGSSRPRATGAGRYAAAEEGARNVGCFKLAVRMRSEGASAGVTMAAAYAWNAENAAPLTPEEVEATVHSAYVSAGVEVQEVEEGSDCWCPGDLVEGHAEEVGWTVSGLVPKRGVTMFTGEGGIGKSFFALDMAIAVASGGKFGERFYCDQGAVVYVDLENDEGTLGRRLKQIGAGRGIDVRILPIHIPKRGRTGVNLAFDTPGGRAWLTGAMAEYAPRLVVIDSLIAAHSGDENSNVAMRQLVGGLDVMARQADCGLLLVHHQRKRGQVNDAGQLMRGASDLRNAVISHFAAKRIREDIVGFEHDKCRPARPSDPFMLRIVDVEDGVRVERVGNAAAENPEVTAAAEREKRIMQRLEQGACRVGELHLVVGGAERSLSRTLKRMVESGTIARIEGERGGMYALAAGGEMFEQEEER